MKRIATRTANDDYITLQVAQAFLDFGCSVVSITATREQRVLGNGGIGEGTVWRVWATYEDVDLDDVDRRAAEYMDGRRKS